MNLHETDLQPTEPAQRRPQDLTEQAEDSLRQAIGMLRGHAEFATVGEIHRLAVERLGFQRSIRETLELLSKLPDIRIEAVEPPEESRVYAPSAWRS